jgi:hypothetical protein
MAQIYKTGSSKRYSFESWSKQIAFYYAIAQLSYSSDTNYVLYVFLNEAIINSINLCKKK